MDFLCSVAKNEAFLAFENFKEILDFLNEIFRIEEVTLYLGSSSSHRVLLITEAVASRNLKIEGVLWTACSQKNKGVERVLMSLKGAADPDITFSSYPPIRFNHFHLFRADSLVFKNATWLTVEQVLALRNCKKVRLKGLRFNAADIKEILQKYIEDPGELEELRMTCKDVIFLQEVVKELNVVRIE
uniref:Mitochondrial transcription termination factor family protein n=1 Tax=Caenorhabditis tropicalis TaxID=1561998 RepID=A0A1I7UT22_9PELO